MQGTTSRRNGEYHESSHCVLCLSRCSSISPRRLRTQYCRAAFGRKLSIRNLVFATLAEQIREVSHFSKVKKVNPRQKQHPIVIDSFSASMQILIGLCCVHNVPITLCMSRLGHLETKQISQHTSSPRHLFGHMSLPRKRREASERITLNTRASKTRHVGSSAAKVCIEHLNQATCSAPTMIPSTSRHWGSQPLFI